MSAPDESKAPNDKPSGNIGESSSSSDADVQKRQYVESLIKSGKAAVAKDGKLPPGATHEIVGTDTDGLPILVRRRFS